MWTAPRPKQVMSSLFLRMKIASLLIIFGECLVMLLLFLQIRLIRICLFHYLNHPLYSTRILSHVVVSKFESKTFRDLPVVCVAPKSSKTIGDLNVVDGIYSFCDKKKDNPSRRYSENYNENDSPITFGYNMVYSAKEDCREVKQLESSFYVSRIENVTKKQEEITSQVKNCSDYSNVSVVSLKSQSPKRFYIKRFKDVNPTPAKWY
jgi:hypothetical protein